MRFTIDRLDHLVLTVRDIDITATWYQRVLGMEIEEYGRHRRTALRFGGQKINLHQAGTPPLRNNGGVGMAEICLVTALQPEDVIAHLHECGVAVEQGPAARLGSFGPVTSVYCRDPDRNLIEIATYLGM